MIFGAPFNIRLGVGKKTSNFKSLIGTPSKTTKDVPLYQFCSFFNIVQDAFDPPPLCFEHLVDLVSNFGGVVYRYTVTLNLARRAFQRPVLIFQKVLNPTLHPYTVPHPIHQWSTPIAPWKQVRPWWRLLNKWFIKGLCTAQWQWHRIFNTKSWFFSASGIFQWASRIKGYLRCSHLCEVGAQFYTNVFSWIQLIVFALGKPQATNITFFTCEPPVTQHSLAECDLGGDQGVQQVLIKTEDPNGADWGETGKKSFRSARAARSSKQNKLGKIKALRWTNFAKVLLDGGRKHEELEED